MCTGEQNGSGSLPTQVSGLRQPVKCIFTSDLLENILPSLLKKMLVSPHFYSLQKNALKVTGWFLRNSKVAFNHSGEYVQLYFRLCGLRENFKFVINQEKS